MSAGEAKTLNVPSHQATLIGIPAPVPVHPPHRGSSTPDSPPVKASAPPEPAAGTDVLASSRLEANGAPSSADAEAEIERRRTAETVRLGPRRTSAEPVSHSTVPQAPDARGSRSTRGLLMVSAVIAAAILGGRYFLLQTQAAAPAAPEPPRVAVAPPASPENRAVPSPTPEAPAAEAPAPSASASPAAEGSAEAAAAASAPPASSAGAPTASGSPAPGSSVAPPAEGLTRVIVKISPPKARLFHKGKPVGSSPVIIDLAPGEKRKYEVGAPGWATRKLVVDGTKSEIFIGLKPE